MKRHQIKDGDFFRFVYDGEVHKAVFIAGPNIQMRSKMKLQPVYGDIHFDPRNSMGLEISDPEDEVELCDPPAWFSYRWVSRAKVREKLTALHGLWGSGPHEFSAAAADEALAELLQWLK